MTAWYTPKPPEELLTKATTMASYKPFSTITHPYPTKASPNRNACAYETGLASARNAFVFIGGLGDGPHTVPYARAIARELAENHAVELSFSVFEPKIRSSFSGYKFSCLTNDVADIAELVRYLRGLGKERIVLMGHSTGCQVCACLPCLLLFVAKALMC